MQALQAPEARLLENKRAVAVSDLSRGLRNNAALAGERQRHPEIDREEVTRPVFIIGINRTGTTYLHRLLSRDPRFWTLRGYELLEPVLTNGTYTETAWTPADVRRLRLQDVVVAAGFSESFAGVHQVDVDEPEEDFGILRQTFASWSNTNIYQVPEYGRWLEATGSRRAYAYHRRAMQHFTWQRHLRQPGQQAQWLLKAPVHLMELEALVAAYPDACFIQTHREPRQFVGSWCSLIEQVRSRISEPPSRHALGEEQLAFMSDMLDRSVRFRNAHPELQQGWCDVNYVDLVDDPWATVRRIYERFGWPLEPAAHAAMEAWQAPAGPAGGAAPWRAAASLRPEGLRLDARSGRRHLLRLPGVHRQPQHPHLATMNDSVPQHLIAQSLPRHERSLEARCPAGQVRSGLAGEQHLAGCARVEQPEGLVCLIDRVAMGDQLLQRDVPVQHVIARR